MPNKIIITKPILFSLASFLFLQACSIGSSKAPTIVSPQTPIASSKYICKNASQYKNNIVGSGHCVALIQQCSGAPLTKFWRPSIRVKGNKIPKGSVIATFKNGRYPNIRGYHAAIYIEQTKDGIWVWDQWLGKAVHKRLIRFKNGKGVSSNDGDRYHLVIYKFH